MINRLKRSIFPHYSHLADKMASLVNFIVQMHYIGQLQRFDDRIKHWTAIGKTITISNISGHRSRTPMVPIDSQGVTSY